MYQLKSLRVQEFKTGKCTFTGQELDMMTKLEELKKHLSGLTFARITSVIANDGDVFAFEDKCGRTVYDYDPDFEARRTEFSPGDWEKADKSYKFFYGFALGPNGDIHWSSKGQRGEYGGITGLGINTNQNRLHPPRKFRWMVGRTVNPDKPHFWEWDLCTESEVLFAKFMLAGKTHFSSEDQRRLYINRHISEGEHTNRLVNMAMLLLARDLDYFLGFRMRHGGVNVDSQVFELCEQYDIAIWEEYKARALAQDIDPALKYSTLSPAPAPKVIKDNISGVGETIGLNTPFAGLQLSQ